MPGYGGLDSGSAGAGCVSKGAPPRTVLIAPPVESAQLSVACGSAPRAAESPACWTGAYHFPLWRKGVGHSGNLLGNLPDRARPRVLEYDWFQTAGEYALGARGERRTSSSTTMEPPRVVDQRPVGLAGLGCSVFGVFGLIIQNRPGLCRGPGPRPSPGDPGFPPPPEQPAADG